MRKTLFSLFLWIIALTGSFAQSYNTLWKQAQQAQEDDLPRTALDIVIRIQQKAEREHKTPQLIRAMCTRLMLGDDISSDSVSFDIARIAAYRDAEKKPVERALWNAVLAIAMDHFSWVDTSYNRTSELCYQEMLADFNALSKASTKKYLPLFVQGKNSKYFNHDVLHVLARHYLENGGGYGNASRGKMLLLSRLITFYKNAGNQEATLLWTLDSLTRMQSHTYDVTRSDDFRRLQQLSEEYSQLQLNAITYVAMTQLGYRTRINDSILSIVAEEGIRRYPNASATPELRNYLLKVRQPELRLSGLQDVMYPSKGYNMRLHFKAKNWCEVRVYRIEGFNARSIAETKQNVQDMPRTLMRSYSFRIKEQPPYVESDTTIRFVAPDEPGLYLIRLYDGDNEYGYYRFNCTRMKYITLDLEKGNSRVSIVDAITGEPILGTRMELRNKPSARESLIHEDLMPDADGNYLIDITNRKNRIAYISCGTDQALPGFTLSSNTNYNQGNKSRTQTRLFTDRGIYRPGQKVIVGGFVYTQKGDNLNAEVGSNITLSLYDSNYKIVAQNEVTTDDLGGFSADFNLPQTVLPGHFTLKAEGQTEPTTMTIEVQEYKRPTFVVELDPLVGTYQPGDTVMLTGTARTYSGLPVEEATVNYKTNRYEFYYWYRHGNEEAVGLQLGDTVTDAEGRFSIPVVLTTSDNHSCRFYFQTRIDVTALHGETQTATQNTYVSYKKAYLSIDWPETICFEHAPTVVPHLYNAQGNNVDATGTIKIKLGKNIIQTDTIRTGQPIRLTRGQIPASGKYIIETEVELDGETFKDKSNVRFFSEHDTHPAAGDNFWYDIRQSTQKDTAYVIIGSARHDVTMFIDTYTKKRIVEAQRVIFSDSLLHYTLTWKREYGDAANITFAFVKEDTLYSQSVNLVKPEPDTRLKMGWVTFRSLLTPGQQEEWRLRITTPDDTPVNAEVMARLYDASLDALYPYDWRFGHKFYRYIPISCWKSRYTSWGSVEGYYPIKTYNTKEMEFTTLNPEIFYVRRRFVTNYAASGRRYATNAMVDAMPTMMLARVAEDYGVAEETAYNEEEKSAPTRGDAGDAITVAPRTNFSETAFFYPTLRTDGNGEVSIVFTLPESLTQWNFRALAHTQNMRYATLDTMAVARKEFTVEPAMPRFVREGDKAQIPVTVRNLTDNTLAGTLLLQVFNSATEKEILKQTLNFSAPANGTQVQTFAIDADKLGGAGVVTIRITGKSGLYGDGEEHFLPVLAAREQVISTLPFTLTNHTAQTLRIDTLWSRSARMADRMLTIEATSNPTWYAVTALPVMANRACYSSTDWAERLYAVVLAKHIAEVNTDISKAFADTALTDWAGVLARNEDLKNTIAEETPWLTEGESEAERAAALATLFDEEQNALKEHTALDGLRKLQRADGSWSWCPGMEGSPYMTSRIVVILARLEKLTGYQTDMLARAYDYMESQLVEYVNEAKKKKYTGCPYTYLRYLYAASLTERKANSSALRNAVKYLVEQIEEDVTTEDMHTKSLCAVILARYGKTKAAQTTLQSLIEHTTLADPQRGRFFDTRRAPMTWGSYRIPTQTSTIEALTMVAPDVMWTANGALVGVRDRVLAEMRLWLLQAKRTQMWETSSASLDAIYALLIQSDEEDKETGASEITNPTTPVRYTLQNASGRILRVNNNADVQGAETVGYICDRYFAAPQINAQSISVRGYDNTIAWGSVYARYTLPVEDVVAGGKGLNISRKLQVNREGTWQPLDNPSAPLSVGERVRIVFTITADQDYDYVSLRTGRPACTEPTNKLSGYQWTESGGCYRVVRDTDLQYFFEKVRKGTHTFTEEVLIDRAGIYTFAPSRLQSLYSPEFQGISEAQIIEAR